MNKKGEFTLLQAITIIAGILSAAIIFAIVAKTISSHAINVNFIAKDSALLADTIQASPQNVRVLYTSEFLANNKPDFFGKSFIVLKQEFVGVEPTNEDAGSYLAKRYFIPSNFFSPVISSVNQATFFMVKEGNIFFIALTPQAIVSSEVLDGTK